MAELTFGRKVTVVNQAGLHARPATLFVEKAKSFRCSIELRKDADWVDGKSILDVLTLAADCGSELEIRATGQDAQQAITDLVALIEKGFAEAEQRENTKDGSGGL